MMDSDEGVLLNSATLPIPLFLGRNINGQNK